MTKEGIQMGCKTVLTVSMVLFTIQLALVAGQTPNLRPSYTWVPGKLTWVSMSDSGEVWGVNSAEDIFKYVAGGSWLWVAGKLVQISVGASGVWGVNAQNQIFRYVTTTGGWENIPGLLTQVASGAEVWGVNSNNQVFRYNTGSNSWDTMPGFLYQISASDGGRVVAINTKGAPFEYINGAWSRMGPTWRGLNRITVGAKGAWGILSRPVGSITTTFYDSNAQYCGTINGTVPMTQIDSGSYNGVERLAAISPNQDIYFIYP